MGIVNSTKVQAEIGYDTLFPGANPAQVYVNGKVCIPENSMGKGSPASASECTTSASRRMSRLTTPST